MRTIAEIHHALRLLPLEDRQAVASWLEGLQDEEVNVPIGVKEPSAVYAVELAYMTVEEYLEFEENSPTRHEYFNGYVHAMSGASTTHNRIVTRLASALLNRFGKGPCEVFMQALKLKSEHIPDKFFYYPDVMVSCDRSGWRDDWILNPRLVVEVQSPSTQHIDRREKAASYRKMPSVEEYVIAAQSSWHLTIFRRADSWVPEVVRGPDGVAEFRSLQMSVPLAEIYRGIFEDPPRPE